METLTRPRTGTRRKVHQDQTPQEVKPQTNQLDAESFLVWIGKLQSEDAIFQRARKRRDKVRKLAKNAGLEMAIADRVMKDADKDPDVVLKYLATYRQYSEWLQAPGAQMSLFDLPSGAMLSHAEREQKAKRAGYTRGLMGQNADLEAYPTDNEFHQVHMQGWHDGQKILLDRIKPINISMESEGEAAADERETEDA
ncbi:MAG: hypothetical protein ABFD96_05770 [Armatimonadia bacterium]